MKIYFRLLSFAKPIEKFAIPYVITTVLSVIFSVLNLTLLAPLFETLISDNPTKSAGLADNAASAFNITAQFKEFVNSSIITNGQEKTLTYICVIIVISVLLSNVFRYFSQRTMEDLRVH